MVRSCVHTNCTNQVKQIVSWRNARWSSSPIWLHTGSTPALTAKIKCYEKNVTCPILSFSNDYLNIIACILYSILKTNSQVAEW